MLMPLNPNLTKAQRLQLCQKKRRYSRLQQAYDALKWARKACKRDGGNPRLINVFPCGDHYHLGTARRDFEKDAITEWRKIKHEKRVALSAPVSIPYPIALWENEGGRCEL